MYVPISVLTTAIDQMEFEPLFPEQCHRKFGARKKKQTSDSTQDRQKYPCKLCCRKSHYASKLNQPQLLSFIIEYEKGASKYCFELEVVSGFFNEGLL